MQLIDGRLVLSTTDLTGHLACPRLTVLDQRAARGELARRTAPDPAVEVLRRRGDDHERLAQPSQATHPAGADRSALEDILAGHATIPTDRGVLLDVTYRLHPTICRSISDRFYDWRLTAAPACGRQSVDDGPWAAGAGLRWIPVEHAGNRVTSPEEVAEVAAGVQSLPARLLEMRGRTPEQIRLVNNLCRVAERAGSTWKSASGSAGARQAA